MKIAGLILATLLTTYFIVGQPLLGARRYRQFRSKLAAGLFVRERYYLTSMGRAWLWLVLLGIILWLTSAPLAAFGLGAPFNWWVTLLLIAAALIIFGVALLIIRRWLKTSEPMQMAAGLGPLRDLLPRTTRERGLWIALSISAGVCEEIICRGFLSWYFLQLAALLLGWQRSWPAFAIALVLSTLIFGLGHAYQGKRGIILTTLVGALLALCYVLTGNLLLPIVLHTLIDAQNAFIAPLLLDLWQRHEKAIAAAENQAAYP